MSQISAVSPAQTQAIPPAPVASKANDADGDRDGPNESAADKAKEATAGASRLLDKTA